MQCHPDVDTESSTCEIKTIPLGCSFSSNPTIHIILIVCRAAVKTQPVMTAEVRLLSVPQPRRAAHSNHNSLTLNVIPSHQPRGNGPIEIPLQLPSFLSPPPLPF